MERADVRLAADELMIDERTVAMTAAYLDALAKREVDACEVVAYLLRPDVMTKALWGGDAGASNGPQRGTAEG